MDEMTAMVAETRANFSKISRTVNETCRPVTAFKNSKPWVLVAPVGKGYGDEERIASCVSCHGCRNRRDPTRGSGDGATGKTAKRAVLAPRNNRTTEGQASSSGFALLTTLIEARLVKPVDPDTAPRYMRYVPFWA